MIKELIKMAGEFDRLGLSKEADKIDEIIRRASEADGWSDEGGIEEYTLEDENPEDSEQGEEEPVQRLMAVQESLEKICKEMAVIARQEMAKDIDGTDLRDIGGNNVSVTAYYSKACKVVMRHAVRLDQLLQELHDEDNTY